MWNAARRHCLSVLVLGMAALPALAQEASGPRLPRPSETPKSNPVVTLLLLALLAALAIYATTLKPKRGHQD